MDSAGGVKSAQHVHSYATVRSELVGEIFFVLQACTCGELLASQVQATAAK